MGLFGKKDKITLDDTEQRLLDEMHELDPASERYGVLATQYEKLTKAEANRSWRRNLNVSLANTVINAVTCVTTTLGVLRHEDKGNVVTTKSLNYTPKPKLKD